MSKQVTAPGSAREYETIYILRPDIDGEAAEKIGARVTDVMTREQGKLTKVELWGRRRLAYPVGKQTRGVYVYVKYLGNGDVVQELERNLRLSDGVLKYQTVVLRHDIPGGDVEIVDDEVKFERLELPPIEEEREDSWERMLGLEEEPRREHEAASRDESRDDVSSDDEGDESDAGDSEAKEEG